MMQLTLYTEPNQIYTDTQITGCGALHRPLGGENANITIDLDNAIGQLTARFINPPLLCEADIKVNGVLFLRGSLSAVRINQIIQLTIES